MTDSEIDQIMQAYAEDAVAYAQKKFGIALDYSEHSLMDVDRALTTMTSTGLIQPATLTSDDQDYLWTLCKVFGGYVGAVIIRNLGGIWSRRPLDGGSDTVELSVADRVTCSPPEKVWKRLTESEFDTIIGYYRGLQHVLGRKLYVPPEFKKPWWKLW